MFLHECPDHQDQLFCLFELKKASLALRIESRLEKIFSMGIDCISLTVWLGEDRKRSATVVGLDLVIGLCMVRRCSLIKGAFVWDQSGIRIIGIMRVSVCLGAIRIPEYLDFHSGYSAPEQNSRNIFLFRNIPNERALRLFLAFTSRILSAHNLQLHLARPGARAY